MMGVSIRKPGGYVENGLSLQWTRGPIIRLMPRSRRWQLRVRLRLQPLGFFCKIIRPEAP